MRDAQAPTCLFNVLADPTEHQNLAADYPGIVAEMTARLADLQARLVMGLKYGDLLHRCVPPPPPLTGGRIQPFARHPCK